MKDHKFPYKWKLRNGYPSSKIRFHSKKVYSTFACGGGSTMGYKLAGYDVIGANDIDPKMAEVYKKNHDPQFYDLCPIGDLLTKELPEQYYNLDILDGSPPCSTFSIAGKRERVWKKNRQFREGQSKQVLSDLFFDWVDLVKELQPKTAIAENVKGMVIGNAKAYAKLVVQELDKAGYSVQLFVLNAASMGVPQKRERVFFICRRRDLKLPKIKLNFNEKSIPFKKIEQLGIKRKLITGDYIKDLWDKTLSNGRALVSAGNTFGFLYKCLPERVVNTITAGGSFVHYNTQTYISDGELSVIGTFPQDYQFLDNKAQYIIGMSVPPIMMAQVAHQVYLQWLKDI